MDDLFMNLVEEGKCFVAIRTEDLKVSPVGF